MKYFEVFDIAWNSLGVVKAFSSNDAILRFEHGVAFGLIVVGLAYCLFFVYGFYDLARKLFAKKNQNQNLKLVYFKQK